MDRVTCGSFLSSIWGFLFNPAHGEIDVVQKSVMDVVSRYSEFLLTEMAGLRQTRDDAVRKLVKAEAQGAVRRADQVEEWVEKVDALDAAVAELLTSSRDHPPLVDQLRDKLKRVRELKGHRGSITRSTELLDAAEDAVERILTDDGVGIIGIHGPPGIGKTALLKKVRDSHQELFPVVVFSNVSRQNSIRCLQEDLIARVSPFLFEERTILGQRKYASVSGDLNPERYAKVLRRALSAKRFLLLLDNLWEKLDLTSIGIPAPDDQNKSKIVFTTNELEVCNAMGARPMEMKLLDEPQAWELFWRKVGAHEALDNPLIRSIAEEIVAHCGGRPLALITVGRAMAEKRLRIEWEHAASKSEGKDKSLHSALKFSYDSLKDDKMRSCLLYCALFPESTDIDKEQLIEYWIGEGLLKFDTDLKCIYYLDSLPILKKRDGRGIRTRVHLFFSC